MKHTLTLHYSVQNGGDGSAYPQFMESKELAEFDQETMAEGWGESCTGSITLESDSPITVKNPSITTHASYLIQMIEREDEEKLQEFIDEFFPDGLPVWTVELDDTYKDKKYCYTKVYANGVFVERVFRKKKYGGERLRENLTNLKYE